MNEEDKNKTTMNQLLSQSPAFPRVNQIIKGKVIEIGKNTVFVDLGPIGTGVILGREIKENQETIKKLKPGEEIFAMVLETENEDGFVELSLKAANKQTAWEELKEIMQNQEPITTKITQANKGGLMVEIKGIAGFLPVSQLAPQHYPRIEDGDKAKILAELNKFVNKDLVVRIIDVDIGQQKLIVSEKALAEQKLKELLQDFKVGDLVEGTISGVVDFGAFVKIDPHTLNRNIKSQTRDGEATGQAKESQESQKDEEDVEVNLSPHQDIGSGGLPQTPLNSAPVAGEEKSTPQILEGLIHISEIDWQLIEDPRQFLKVGQSVQAKIIGIEGERLSLSLKALKKDPWSEIEKRYQKGQVVKGEVTKFNPFGAFVQLDKEIHGLVHISDFGNEQTMRQTLQVGQGYDFKILSIESKIHKMALSLAKEETPKTE